MPSIAGTRKVARNLKPRYAPAMAKSPKRPSLVTRGFLGASAPLELIPLVRQAAYGSRISVSAWVTQAIEEKLKRTQGEEGKS